MGDVITETSQRIAKSINDQMKSRHLKVSELNSYLADEVSSGTIRRMRNGAAGISIRACECILAAVGLRLAVVPNDHDAII